MPFFAVLLVDVQGTFRLLTDEQYGGDLYLITTAKRPVSTNGAVPGLAKALNLGVLAWPPLGPGVLSGKYHGEGKADGGRMTNEGLKAFFPGEQHAADHLGRGISRRTDWSQHGASCTRLVAPSNAASNSDHWSAEGISTPGQSRQFGSLALRRTIEIPRWSKPNRARTPPEYLRERNDSCN